LQQAKLKKLQTKLKKARSKCKEAAEELEELLAAESAEANPKDDDEYEEVAPETDVYVV
jgi:hypothetical protein